MPNISGHTKTICLIGSPVEHSLSPAMHTFSFEQLGVDCVYLAYNVEPDQLEAAVNGMKELGFLGYNVTMPHKTYISRYLDELSPAAELMGAINTVVIKDGKAIGHNTDGAGFMKNIAKYGVVPEESTFTLIGPGGAGSAIMVQAALDGVKTVHIFARENGPSYKHAQTLIEPVKEQTGCDFILHPYEDKEAMKAAIEESNVLVNATPVGMGEGSTESAVPAEFIKPGMVVADAVYFPLHTQLLQDAEAKGCTVVTGIGMMNEQAAIGEEIWYGIDMPLDKVTEELNS